MFFNILYNIIISIVIIFIVHNIFDYVKNTLTTPKIKDLINKPKNEYDKINNLINSNSINNFKSEKYINNSNSDDSKNNKSSLNIDNIDNIDNINNIDSEHIKSELKDFFNELNNNTSNNNSFETFSDSKYASMY